MDRSFTEYVFILIHHPSAGFTCPQVVFYMFARSHSADPDMTTAQSMGAPRTRFIFLINSQDFSSLSYWCWIKRKYISIYVFSIRRWEIFFAWLTAGKSVFQVVIGVRFKLSTECHAVCNLRIGTDIYRFILHVLNFSSLFRQ